MIELVTTIAIASILFAMLTSITISFRNQYQYQRNKHLQRREMDTICKEFALLANMVNTSNALLHIEQTQESIICYLDDAMRFIFDKQTQQLITYPRYQTVCFKTIHDIQVRTEIDSFIIWEFTMNNQIVFTKSFYILNHWS